MADKDVEGNLENRLIASELSLTNINTIWDLRRLLKSSQERLKGLKQTSIHNDESMQFERAIIRGVSKEIKRLEKEALCPDPFLH